MNGDIQCSILKKISHLIVNKLKRINNQQSNFDNGVITRPGKLVISSVQSSHKKSLIVPGHLFIALYSNRRKVCAGLKSLLPNFDAPTFCSVAALHALLRSIAVGKFKLTPKVIDNRLML